MWKTGSKFIFENCFFPLHVPRSGCRATCVYGTRGSTASAAMAIYHARHAGFFWTAAAAGTCRGDSAAPKPRPADRFPTKLVFFSLVFFFYHHHHYYFFNEIPVSFIWQHRGRLHIPSRIYIYITITEMVFDLRYKYYFYMSIIPQDYDFCARRVMFIVHCLWNKKKIKNLCFRTDVCNTSSCWIRREKIKNK